MTGEVTDYVILLQFLSVDIIASFVPCCSDKKSQTLFYDKDNNRCTPVLIAAASGHEDAFHCLMKYVDLADPKNNPIFLAFQAQYEKMAILQV